MIKNKFKYSFAIKTIIMMVLLNVLVGFDNLFSQTDEFEKLEILEEEMYFLFKNLKQETDNAEIINLNNQIKLKLEEALEYESSFDYPFDSLKYIFKERTNDKYLRIYNWNTSLADGSFRYYGYIQYFSDSEKKFLVYELYDDSNRIVNPEKKELKPDNWFGALYYKIIPQKYKRDKYYILFGWDGNDDYTTKKLIDVLYFDNDKPTFGSPIFKTSDGRNNRVIFEYAKNVSMTLTYDEKAQMIIFDHLAPQKAIYEGKFNFYGPVGSYDGFEHRKGKWIFVDNVDARNPIPKRRR